MTQINAYVHFDGNCREAMEFYKEILGGDLSLMPVDESPLAAQCEGAKEGSIMHAALMKNGNLLLMASDMMGKESLKQGNNFALSLNCNSEDDINNCFLKLSVGGIVIEPIKRQFWGALFGMCKDKFGIGWMLSYDENNKN